MVKKLILMTVLMLGIVFTVSMKQVNALDAPVDLDWVSNEYASTYWQMMIEEIPVPLDTTSFSFRVPNSIDIDWDQEFSQFASFIRFRTPSGNHDFSLLPTTISSMYVSFAYTLALVEGVDVSDATMIDIYIVLKPETLTEPITSGGITFTTYAGFWNYYTSMWFDYPLFTVRFYNAMILYDTYTFISVPDKPTDPTPLPNYVFTGWRTINGDIFDFTFVTENMFSNIGTNAVLNLYAQFQLNQDIEFDTGDPDINAPQALTTILTAFGMNNYSGFIVLYVLCLSALTIGLLLLKLSGFIIVLVDIIVTALFMFLGWLPIFVSIIIMMVFTLGVLLTLKSRSVGESI
jgi:uncharacterized repeat protein (TIGR02543 family)